MATPTDQLLSRTIYSTDGTTTVWDFSFSGGYIDAAHVKAYTETPAGIRTAVTGTLIGAYQLQITPAIASGDTLVIYRDTPKSVPLVDFTDESGFSEVALDTNAKQAVFIAAEGADILALTDLQAAFAAAEAAALSAQSAAASELATYNLTEAVNANSANINTVASSIASVQAVGTNIAAVVTNATNIADIAATAGNSANINLTATNTANITTVATNIVDVNTVATNIATVVEAAAILNATPFARTLLDDTTAAAARTTLGAAASGANADITSLNGTALADFYKKANILGTVSQSAGVPTGAVIERGSNANGEYTKWADGTMICVCASIMGNPNIALGSVFRSDPIQFNFPAAFTVNPNCSAFVLAGSSQLGSFTGRYDTLASLATTYYRVALLSALSGVSVSVGVTAIGRWF